jgi:hypothetical protein
MAAMGMGNGKSSMSMPTPSSTMSGSWSSTSATASASSPVYTGAAHMMSGNIASVVGAGLVVAAALI